MGAVRSRLQASLDAADRRTAYARSGAFALALVAYAALQAAVFPFQTTVSPLALLLELSIIVAAVGAFVAFDFLRESPDIYWPMVAGAALVGVSATTGLLSNLLATPIWFDVLFENFAFVVAIGAFLVAISRWSEAQAKRERELERRNERLDSFASVVSHDLRNPLQVASASAQAARETGDEEHFERLERSLERMDAIVEDVLEFARLGTTSADPGEIQLSTVASEAWETVEADGATMAVTNDGTVDADRSLLRQALENLFRNSIEHGGPDVAVRVGVEAGWIYVADDGPGIPSAERSQVLDSGYSTAESGTGFGLAIVRTVADAHDWEVRVVDSVTGGVRIELGSSRAFSPRR